MLPLNHKLFSSTYILCRKNIGKKTEGTPLEFTWSSDGSAEDWSPKAASNPLGKATNDPEMKWSLLRENIAR